MSWANLIQQAMNAYLASQNTSAPTEATSAPAGSAPAPATSSSEGSGSSQKLRWAPDYSSFTTNPELVWREASGPGFDTPGTEAGWYKAPASVDPIWGSPYDPTGGRVYAFDNQYGQNSFDGGPTHSGRDLPTYAELKAAGYDSWADPTLRAHFTARAGGRDPFTDPSAMAEVLMGLYEAPRSAQSQALSGFGGIGQLPIDPFLARDSGLSTGQYLGREQGNFAYNELIRQGAPEEYAAAMRDAINDYQIKYEQARKEAEKEQFSLGGIGKGLFEFGGQVLSLPPVMALLGAGMLPGVSQGFIESLAGAGATAAGASAVAPEVAALFSGLDDVALAGADLAGAGAAGAAAGPIGAPGAAEALEVINFSPNSLINQPAFMNQQGLGLTEQEMLSRASAEGAFNPAMYDLAEGTTYLPGAFEGYDPITGLAEFNEALTVAPTATPSTFEQLQSQFEQAQNTVDKYKDLGKIVDSLTGGPAADAPTLDEGEDPNAHAAELILYMGLDPETIAAAGYEPGTREYYDYVLSQADAIIMQILGEVGDTADAEELSAALRAKSAEELQDLQRALYVRGQMGTLMGSGEYTDPFSGQEVDVLGSGMFNPATGAYGAGLASDVDTLAQLGSTDPGAARAFLQQLLDRDPDLFGMQARQDAALEQAKRSEMGDERKRRGMFGFY